MQDRWGPTDRLTATTSSWSSTPAGVAVVYREIGAGEWFMHPDGGRRSVRTRSMAPHRRRALAGAARDRLGLMAAAVGDYAASDGAERTGRRGLRPP